VIGANSEALERFIDSEGVWCQVLPRARRGGPALFLDRDGVVVEEVDFLCRVDDIRIVPGAATVITEANRRRIPVVLITNQSGIARRYFGWREFHAVQAAILEVWAKNGARVDAVYACPFHPAGEEPYAHPNHPARKPNPGMVLRAAAALDLDLGRSWLVGDRIVDIQAARAAGLAGAMHVLTGYGKEERPKILPLATREFQIRLGRSIADALELLPHMTNR